MTRRRRFLIISLTGASALLLVACLGLCSLYPAGVRAESEGEIALAKASGLPTTLEEIPLRRVSPQDDARPFYMRAMRLAKAEHISTLEKGFNSPATQAEIEKAYLILPAAKPWLDLVEAGARKPACSWTRNYQRDGYLYPDDDLRFLRLAAKGLAILARVYDDAGQHDKALRTIALIYSMDRQVNQGPTFIDKVAAIGLQRIALRALRRSLFVGANPVEVERLALYGAEIPNWQEGYKTDFVIGLSGLQKGMLPYSYDARSKKLEALLSTFGIKAAIIMAYVKPYRKAWERFGPAPGDPRRIQRTLEQWKTEMPNTPGPLGDLERYVSEPFSDTFGDSWGRFLADRLIVADAARIRCGKPPRQLDPFTGKPFRREDKNGKRYLWSPGPTSSVKDDLMASLP
ncbi:hypothetical protein BH11ARM2_BH11ARM2_03460 [soil metagenome]